MTDVQQWLFKQNYGSLIQRLEAEREAQFWREVNGDYGLCTKCDERPARRCEFPLPRGLSLLCGPCALPLLVDHLEEWLEKLRGPVSALTMKLTRRTP